MDIELQAIFYQHLGQLADEATVVCTEDVRDVMPGQIILEKGSKILPETLTQLGQIQLKKPLFHSIRCLDPLTVPAIRVHMQKSVTKSPGIQLLLGTTQRYGLALDCTNRLNLPAPLINLLTVMAHRLPELYEHSLSVAAIAACLGSARRLETAEIIDLLCIGLCHDIGLLFLDPALLDRRIRLSWAQWNQMYRHPRVAFEVLQGIGGMNPAVLTAILNHHERIDGTGYPQGLQNYAIDAFGQIIAVAEMVAGASRRPSKAHLKNALAANVGKLDAALLGVIEAALGNVSDDQYASQAEQANCLRRLESIMDALQRWYKLGDVIIHPTLIKTAQGLAAIQQILDHAELNQAAVNADTRPFSRDEIGAILEAHFQLGQILQQVFRNKAVYRDMEPKAVSSAFARWVIETERSQAILNDKPAD